MLKTLDSIGELKGKKVFVRTDFNVPIKDGVVKDLNRVRESLPTINYLLDKGARVILASHLGRPESPGDPKTSMIPVANELEKMLGKPLKKSNFVIGDETTWLVGELKDGEVMIIENLRWCAGEEAGDDEFAKALASLADIYVNDAFAVSHRPHASVFTITKYLPSYAGLLLQKEIDNLSKITTAPYPPFVLVLGGAKISDKIGVVDYLAGKVHKILIGGAMANTFMAARGQDISKSLFEADAVEQAKNYLDKYGDQIVLPVDDSHEEVDGGFSIKDIGSETIKNFSGIISEASTVFWNGNLGYSEEAQFAVGTNEIAKAIAANGHCYSVVAGGDTVGAIDALGLKEEYGFVSTGGGAALEFLSGKELPGIKAVEE